MKQKNGLKAEAEILLRKATWVCQKCGGDMPLEYEEDDDDEVGYCIIGATCKICGTRYDRSTSEEYGLRLDECTTMELLGM